LGSKTTFAAPVRLSLADALSDAIASLVLLRRVVAETSVGAQEAEILLRPNDSRYHRLKAK
jgi:hypothetical protein